jgi:hypothetical protein
VSSNFGATKYENKHKMYDIQNTTLASSIKINRASTLCSYLRERESKSNTRNGLQVGRGEMDPMAKGGLGVQGGDDGDV